MTITKQYGAILRKKCVEDIPMAIFELWHTPVPKSGLRLLFIP